MSRSASILVCDDDALTRELIAHALEALGHQVSQAEDGIAAQTEVAQKTPDLIVIDILMPRLSGLEFIEWFRAQELNQFTPVLLVTALSDVDYRIRGLNAGADDYLTKPFHLKELEARVEVLLRTKLLNTELHERNQELIALQEQLVRKERELAVFQLAGAAAHEIRQPVTSLLMRCFEIEKLAATLPTAGASGILSALQEIQREAGAINQILESLTQLDTADIRPYVKGVSILNLAHVDKQSK